MQGAHIEYLLSGVEEAGAVPRLSYQSGLVHVSPLSLAPPNEAEVMEGAFS